VTTADDDPRSDLELLQAHIAGDRQAFGQLFHRHRDRLWAVSIRTLGEREEAADALQDALLSACRAAGNFRGDAAVTTWLHRIVVNACLDRLRRRQARNTVPLPELEAIPAPDADQDTRVVVQAALAKLPADQRAALVLTDLEGYPVSEAARLLEVPEGTVKSRCARGRARLAILLGHLRNPTPERDVSSTTSRPATRGEGRG
jgi:RNA polymerase sigma-70 factor, ECF subfamily